MSNKGTVAIVDDHLLVAKALSGIISNFRDFEVLYELGNGAEMVEKFKHAKVFPELVLLDIAMPEMNGYETAAWLREHHPLISVLALSVQDDEDSVIKMIKAGAKGYLHKNAHPAELEKALQAVVTKGFYYPDWATSKILGNISRDHDTSSKESIKMSERELEFLQHACSELTYKEIADIMCCSPRTVEGYRDGLFDKLQLKTRTGLAMYALRNNLCS